MTTSAQLVAGDAKQILSTLEPNAYDGCLSDPPYGLKFMGKAWDHGVPSAEVWAEVLRVLKPGAHLMAFGGTRTHHRLMVAIEDAGFEIRDCLMWLYGSGFPKSLDVGKAIDKAMGAERVVRPIRRRGGTGATTGDTPGRFTGNVQCDDCGKWRFSPDPCRCPKDSGPATPLAHTFNGYGTALKPAWEPVVLAMKPTDGTYAANAERWGVAGLNVDGGRVRAEGDGSSPAAKRRATSTAPVSPGSYEKEASGRMTNRTRPERYREQRPGEALGRWPANLILDEDAGAMLDAQAGESPSRYFYCAKVSPKERNMGGIDCRHPTLKPIALTTYFATLLEPPRENSRLLVPFCGAGSEMIGGLRAGWDRVLGIDNDPQSLTWARARIRASLQQARREEPDPNLHLPLEHPNNL